MEREQIENEREEEEKCDAEIVPFITRVENLQRQPRQSQYFQSVTIQLDFYIQKSLKPEFYQAKINAS